MSLSTLAARCMRLSILHKTPLLESKAEIVAQRIAEHCCGYGASDAALANIGADEVLQRLEHYKAAGADIFAPFGTAMDRLEAANAAELAKPRREGIGASPKKMMLTDGMRKARPNPNASAHRGKTNATRRKLRAAS